jgi:F420-dependent oxidoreductase-like protein
MHFGIHTGQQNAPLDQFRRLWRFADDRGFEWVSVWDHFYPILTPVTGPCFEAVSVMTALAAETKRVRVACLVFCMAYRHPAVLANAAVTIDHVSGGRVELGLGCGWHQAEFDAYGIPFLPIRDRLDQLEEGARIIRSMFENDKTTFEGKHYRLTDAYCEPKPVQKRPRIWIGGMGEKRLLRIVARHADAWNTPLATADVYAQKNRVLDQWCEKEGRDPRSIVRSVNVGLVIGANEREAAAKRQAMAERFGAAFASLEPSILVGTPQQVIDRVGAYEKAGAEWTMLSLRAPFDWDGYEIFTEEVFPAFGVRRPAA